MSCGTVVDSELVEEETIRCYNPSQYYPVTIGQDFHERYVTAVKLGCGGYSTVWLCKDKV